MKKIAIVTVNYNGRDNTLELLESLSKLRTTNYQLRTIVVDNASSDGSVKAIKKQFPNVDVLQTGENLGFGEGLNKGFDYGSIWGADYFLIINNDSKIADPEMLQILIKTMQKDPKIGMVVPKILFEKGYEFHKDRYIKDQIGKVIWYGGGSFDWDNIHSIHRGIDEVDVGQYNEEEEVKFITGACFLIKKEVLEKVSGFDDKYFLYFEDAYLNKKIIDEGYKLYYTGNTFVYHKVSQSTGVGSTLTDYYHTRNRLMFGMQYGKFRTKFALLREALKFLIFGRQPQKMGVWDYILCKKGRTDIYHKQNKVVEYPLELSIGIVNYNTAKLTKELVESLLKQDSGFNKDTMEIIVLDNGDIDPSYLQLQDYLPASPATRGEPKIKYLKNEQNEGFTKGYNKTIKFALGEYYLMLNSDISVLKDGISEILKWGNEFKGNAVLGGKLVFPDLSNQDSAFHLPTLTGAFKEYFLGQKGSYFMFLPKSENPSKIEGAVMACLLIPQKILKKVGLLNESTFIFFEDIEYARRLKKFNIPMYFVPSAKFIHHHGASTKKIGVDKSMELLQKSAKAYHGKLYYFMLSLVLRIGQKLNRVKTPVSRWTKKD